MTAWEATLERELTARRSKVWADGYEAGWNEAVRVISGSLRHAWRIQFTRPQAARFVEDLAEARSQERSPDNAQAK